MAKVWLITGGSSGPGRGAAADGLNVRAAASLVARQRRSLAAQQNALPKLESDRKWEDLSVSTGYSSVR